LNVVVSGGYVFVATNPGEIHITNSVFVGATVWRGFMCVRKCYACRLLMVALSSLTLHQH
jgi:hypothetical protein